MLLGAVMRLPIWSSLTEKLTPSNIDIATYLLTNGNSAERRNQLCHAGQFSVALG